MICKFCGQLTVNGKCYKCGNYLTASEKTKDIGVEDNTLIAVKEGGKAESKRVVFREKKEINKFSKIAIVLAVSAICWGLIVDLFCNLSVLWDSSKFWYKIFRFFYKIDSLFGFLEGRYSYSITYVGRESSINGLFFEQNSFYLRITSLCFIVSIILVCIGFFQILKNDYQKGITLNIFTLILCSDFNQYNIFTDCIGKSVAFILRKIKYYKIFPEKSIFVFILLILVVLSIVCLVFVIKKLFREKEETEESISE